MTGTPNFQNQALRHELAALRRSTAALRRAVSDGIFTGFTPEITASVNPSIGDGTATSAWTRFGDLVYYVGNITFGTVGVSAGTGTYLISLPVAAGDAVLSGTGLASGHWRCTGGGLFSANEVVIFPGQTVMRCRYSAAFPFGAETNVSATAPWAWGNSYRIEWEVSYLAAPY